MKDKRGWRHLLWCLSAILWVACGDSSSGGSSEETDAASVSDTDFDGVPDDQDNCPSAPNNGQQDSDGDGTGDQCEGDIDGDGFVPPQDCAEGDPLRTPNALEDCTDGIDNDCDQAVDNQDRDCSEAEPFIDNDGDGYPPTVDCDDLNPNAYPGAPEICNNGDDDNCNNDVDENCDQDSDGVIDFNDNCPQNANAGQEDVDNDGTGNACDHENCATSNDCLEGMICVDNVCQIIVIIPPGDTDQDDDGVADNEDNCSENNNPNQEDEDADGLGNVCDEIDNRQCVNGGNLCPGAQVCRNGTCVETCGEAVCLPNQVCQNGQCVNPGGEEPQDTDGDGVLDATDNCVNAVNPNQSNLDGDDNGDACDIDLDGDGIRNGQDNCPRQMNADQLDDDRDGIGNSCDPVNDDPDGDGIPNARDNCPNVRNAGQVDEDGDGVGDACDEPAAPVDSDQDGIDDPEDNCPTHVNPTQGDRDADGTGDACDPQCVIYLATNAPWEFEYAQSRAVDGAGNPIAPWLDRTEGNVFELCLMAGETALFTATPNGQTYAIEPQGQDAQGRWCVDPQENEAAFMSIAGPEDYQAWCQMVCIWSLNYRCTVPANAAPRDVD